ncbi:RecX family transcriptional regulator [Thermoleophilia bacterium SCSIO 60948]|nr:RecX family transcriptional regulator [Thermoleophilia bacterium SCSIO 60948]
MSLIGRRERTERQVRDHLASRGFDEAALEDAVARLIEIGALDDARYARLFAEDKRELEGWGPERIVATLVDHGVARSVIDRSVELEDREDQLERAAGLLASRGDLDTDAGRRRALSFLARRGFEAELCYDAIRRAA